jgi:predicted deacylase
MKKSALALALLLAGWSGLLAQPARAAGPSPLAPYPSCEEALARIRELAAAHPDRVEAVEIGRSVAGRPILALHFHLGAEAKPQALITGGIHAEEFIGTEAAWAAAQELAEGRAEELLERADVWVVPLLNIDGHCQVYESQGRGDRVTKARKNLHGVDLNRNFPEVPGSHSRHPLAGNRRPRSSYYMGSQALSEPESRALAELAGQQHFYAAVNLHSVSGKFLYPFCYTKAPAPQAEAFARMGQALVARQPRYHYAVQQSYSWYPTLGDLDDFLYVRQGALSATVEVGTVKKNLPHALKTMKFFWVSNPRDVQDWTGNDAPAVLAALLRAFELTGGAPLPAGAKPGPAEKPAIRYPTAPVP